MMLSKIKKYKKDHKTSGALLMKNPVLVLGLGLPFIISSAISLKNAVAMTIQVFIVHIITMLLGIITRNKLPLWQRTLANVCIATVMMLISKAIVESLIVGIASSMGMFIFLMAVNSMTIVLSSYMVENSKIWPVLSSAFLNASGFSIVAIATALLREYFGNNTIWGIAIKAPIKLNGLLMPFSGFIILGIFLAASRFFNKKYIIYKINDAKRKDKHYTKIHVQSVKPID